jgi:hypothetical protein
MKKTIYVKITGCRYHQLWYNNCIGNIYPVYADDGEYFVDHDIMCANSRLIIFPQDFKEVHIQETPTDIAGEPLEVGDAVLGISIETEYERPCNFLAMGNNGSWYCEDSGNIYSFVDVRKVKQENERKIIPINEHPDPLNLKPNDKLIRINDGWYVRISNQNPKPVDPIEEVYREDQNNGFPGELWRAERILKKYRDAASAHIEFILQRIKSVYKEGNDGTIK